MNKGQSAVSILYFFFVGVDLACGILALRFHAALSTFNVWEFK